ncbi:MAG: capsular biosynthesis protein [Sphingobium sp.]
MKAVNLGRRSFLFLQGPPGPLFALLAERLRERGHTVYRINLNGGDQRDWPTAATAYRGTMSNWPLFVHDFMEKHRITDLILYGDCRPVHVAAHGMAQLRGVAIHVLEEGYIRPDWMTWEPDGVNGHSTLPKDPDWYLDQASRLPPLPDLPPITASFRRRAYDSYQHYHRIITGRWRYPFYRTHRPGSLLGEGLSWMVRLATEQRRMRRADAVLEQLKGQPYFLLPLQLSSDYQIRIHSPFADMRSAARLIISSFARYAPPGTYLLVKDHPLYSGIRNWGRFVRRQAAELGMGNRIIHISGGNLDMLSAQSLGMVCVNSTSGTLALGAGTPVKVLGEAVYDMPGITDQQQLDRFWSAPQAPDPRIWEAFRRVLHARCLIRGGLASQSAIAILLDGLIERLCPENDMPAIAMPAIACLS